MPSLTNTVAGTLTLPLKETICIVLSFDQRDIGFSVLIILTNLWKLVRLSEDPFYTTKYFDPPKTEVNAFGYSQITMSEWPVPTL